MRAGIAIDTWKLSIFHEELTKYGFGYTQGVGLTKDTMMLYVETDDKPKLAFAVQEAQKRCAKVKR